MAEQQLVNTKGAFGYGIASTDGTAQRRGQNTESFRNMSTVNTVTPGQTIVLSTLIGEGNEALPGTTVADGTQVILGIAVSSATTNSNTTNVTSNHPTGAFFDAVTEGVVNAFVTSVVEKGDLLTISASTVAPISGGRLAPLTTAVTTRASIVGVALTSGTSGTTNPNGRVLVRPQFLNGPTS